MNLHQTQPNQKTKPIGVKRVWLVLNIHTLPSFTIVSLSSALNPTKTQPQTQPKPQPQPKSKLNPNQTQTKLKINQKQTQNKPNNKQKTDPKQTLIQ